MLKKLVLLATLALAPSAALALPDAPTQSAAYTVSGALFDKITKTTVSPTINKTQGVNGYVMDFHDDKYKYSLPICEPSSLVETTGANIDPTAFNTGDTLVVSAQPNDKTSAKSCINRVVRQPVDRGSSNGECLQGYQVKHEVEDTPERLLVKTEYVYHLTVYARPTLDCDGKTYGSSPITTVVARTKPFIVTLWRDSKEITRWSLTTDTDGKAQFLYTFGVAADYQFKIKPAGTATAGDEIGWAAKVTDPNASPSPAPASTSSTPGLSPAPILIALFIIMLVAISAEYWHWTRRKRAREHELPEQEYQRTQKL